MGSATQYTRLSRTLMPMAETSARISIMGQRMATRIIIWKVFCRVATSEVSRVTMDAVENVALPLSFRGMPRAARIKRAKQYLRLVGLEKFMTHMPNQMSGGQQQRVGIARALAMNPQIIFADEPTGNLDSKTTMEVLKLMQKVVREEKQTLVMVTHDNNLATYADRIFKIIDGKIVSIEENHHEVDLVQLEESMQAAAEAQAERKSKNPAAEEQIETVVEAEEHQIEGKSE